jgi:hypothetical protein
MDGRMRLCLDDRTRSLLYGEVFDNKERGLTDRGCPRELGNGSFRGTVLNAQQLSGDRRTTNGSNSS